MPQIQRPRVQVVHHTALHTIFIQEGVAGYTDSRMCYEHPGWRSDGQTARTSPEECPSTLVKPPMEPNLATMGVLVGLRLKAHACALVELQVVQHVSTQWLIWGQVNECDLWKVSRHEKYSTTEVGGP